MGFREYFIEQAEVADYLHDQKHEINCYIIATAAIDALAEIWESDFPSEAAALASEFHGKVPGAVRMSRFVQKFASGDPKTRKIAVIRFAEDAKRFAPTVAPAEVDALLNARKSKERELPSTHKDVDLATLALEAPTLLSNPAVRRLAEEYHYPALLYSLYRCR